MQLSHTPGGTPRTSRDAQLAPGHYRFRLPALDRARRAFATITATPPSRPATVTGGARLARPHEVTVAYDGPCDATHALTHEAAHDDPVTLGWGAPEPPH